MKRYMIFLGFMIWNLLVFSQDCSNSTVNGPFCDLTNYNNSNYQALGCGSGINALIQKIDVSNLSTNQYHFISSISFFQNLDLSINNLLNINLYANPNSSITPYFGNQVNLIYDAEYSLDFSNNFSTVELPTISNNSTIYIPENTTTITVEFIMEDNKCVHTPSFCNGTLATGFSTYMVAPNCGSNNPTFFNNFGSGWQLDAIFQLDIISTPKLIIDGPDTICRNEFGVLTATPSGESYSWSSGQSSQSISVTEEDTYRVTVDYGDCSVSIGKNITTVLEPNKPFAIPIQGNCSNKGAIFIDESFPNQFSYSIDGANYFSIKLFDDLDPGEYWVTKKNESDLGCTSDPTFVVILPPISSITFKDSINQPSCDNSTGSIFIKDIIGGQAPYQFQWQYDTMLLVPPIIDRDSIVNVLPGVSYTVTITDINDCSVTKSFILDSPKRPKYFLFNKVDESCPGANNGSISIVPKEGLPPFSIVLDSNLVQSYRSVIDDTLTLSNLTPDIYGVTIYDHNCRNPLEVSNSTPSIHLPYILTKSDQTSIKVPVIVNVLSNLLGIQENIIFDDSHVRLDSVSSDIISMTEMSIQNGYLAISKSSFTPFTNGLVDTLVVLHFTIRDDSMSSQLKFSDSEWVEWVDDNLNLIQIEHYEGAVQPDKAEYINSDNVMIDQSTLDFTFDIQGDLSGCNGDDNEVSVSKPFDNYTWSANGDDFLEPFFNTGVLNPGPHILNLSLSLESDNVPNVFCSIDTSFDIEIFENPEPMILGGKPTYCEGDTINLSSSIKEEFGNTIEWSGDEFEIGISFVAEENFNIILKVTDINGCRGIADFDAKVFNNPSVNISSNTVNWPIEYQDQFNLNTSVILGESFNNIINFDWSVNPSNLVTLFDPTVQNYSGLQFNQFTSDTGFATFTVEVTDQAGCKATDSYLTSALQDPISCSINISNGSGGIWEGGGYCKSDSETIALGYSIDLETGDVIDSLILTISKHGSVQSSQILTKVQDILQIDLDEVGFYTYKLILVSQQGCRRSVEASYTVVDNPIANFTIDKDTVCQSDDLLISMPNSNYDSLRAYYTVNGVNFDHVFSKGVPLNIKDNLQDGSNSIKILSYQALNDIGCESASTQEFDLIKVPVTTFVSPKINCISATTYEVNIAFNQPVSLVSNNDILSFTSNAQMSEYKLVFSNTKTNYEFSFIDFCGKLLSFNGNSPSCCEFAFQDIDSTIIVNDQVLVEDYYDICTGDLLSLGYNSSDLTPGDSLIVNVFFNGAIDSQLAIGGDAGPNFTFELDDLEGKNYTIELFIKAQDCNFIPIRTFDVNIINQRSPSILLTKDTYCLNEYAPILAVNTVYDSSTINFMYDTDGLNIVTDTFGRSNIVGKIAGTYAVAISESTQGGESTCLTNGSFDITITDELAPDYADIYLYPGDIVGPLDIDTSLCYQYGYNPVLVDTLQEDVLLPILGESNIYMSNSGYYIFTQGSDLIKGVKSNSIDPEYYLWMDVYYPELDGSCDYSKALCTNRGYLNADRLPPYLFREDQQMAFDIVIAPNPNGGRFSIYLGQGASSDNIALTIYNLSGQVLYQQRIAYDAISKAINIQTDLTSGMYIIHLTGDKIGNITSKLIIEN